MYKITVMDNTIQEYVHNSVKNTHVDFCYTLTDLKYYWKTGTDERVSWQPETITIQYRP